MLDSYVDQAEDSANGAHSYIAHYPSSEVAVRRLRETIQQSAQALGGLCNGSRHAVIVGCMVAMYLSKDSARAPTMRTDSRVLAEAGGSLARMLLPVLRMWRVVYGQADK